jgi:Ala-tRNA(Pro) deacylase
VEEVVSMTAQRLHEFLDSEGVDYEVTSHEQAFAAHEVAHAEQVSGWDVAKAIMLNVGGELAMVVLPAPVEVDLDKASRALGGADVRLAQESEFEDVFDDSELGAHPPFGNLYGVPVFVDETMRERKRMICRDGSHTEAVTISTDDFMRVVGPEVIDAGRRPG